MIRVLSGSRLEERGIGHPLIQCRVTCADRGEVLDVKRIGHLLLQQCLRRDVAAIRDAVVVLLGDEGARNRSVDPVCNEPLEATSTEEQKWKLAEREGFEPPVPFRVQWFSRPPPSTTRPSLRVGQKSPEVNDLTRTCVAEQLHRGSFRNAGANESSSRPTDAGRGTSVPDARPSCKCYWGRPTSSAALRHSRDTLRATRRRE